MKYLLYFALGALALRLPDLFIQLTREPYNPGYIVRNGINNAVTCDGGMEFVVEYEGGGEETTVTPPWEYEIFWN